jgi:dimethylamine/trimethylamine dehydrogenase
LGAVLAEKLRLDGLDVTLVTSADRISAWTVSTLEQHAIQKRVLTLGIEVHVSRNIVEFDGSGVVLECTYTERRTSVPARSVVTVTSRLPNDELAQSLNESSEAVSAAGIVSITSIGDCFAPGTIAAAVYAGHRRAREFDWPVTDEAAFQRELPDMRAP